MAETSQVAVGGNFLEEILEETKASSPEVREVYKTGLSALLDDIVSHDRQVERVDKSLVDSMIAEIDARLSAQLDAIMHNEDFQKLESAWRGLKLVVDRADFGTGIQMELLNISKEQLLEDFEDAPEITRSGFYKHVYNTGYGVYGGEPYGAIVSNYAFSHHPEDVELLKNVSSVAAMSHAPFIASTDASMFGVEKYEDLTRLGDLKDIFEGPEYAKWRSFRESEDARYVALTAPRFLLRLPYGSNTKRVKEFNYEESVSEHEAYLWGNTAYALATRLTDSFAKYGWCPNIIGPRSGGTVSDLPVHNFEAMGSIETKIPTEVLISERLEYEMSDAGFVALTMRKGTDNACFFSANSVQARKSFGNSPEGKEAETNFTLGTQLPYVFIVSRLAHYLKVLQRENVGSWKERVQLEKELNNWIRQYVADMDNPSPGVRGRRPLRQAQVIVEDVEGEPGWYKVDVRVRPHFKYMGAYFTLSLVGKLDKQQ